MYYCVGRYAKGNCPARATIRASYLDSYVEQTVFDALTHKSGFLADAVEATDKLVEAQRALEQADHELTLYLETDLISTVGQEAFLAGVGARQTRIDETRALVDALRAETAFAEHLTTGDLLAAWPELSAPEKRPLLYGLLDRVVLHRDDKTRNKSLAQPLAARVEIMLRGGTQFRPRLAKLNRQSWPLHLTLRRLSNGF